MLRCHEILLEGVGPNRHTCPTPFPALLVRLAVSVFTLGRPPYAALIDLFLALTTLPGIPAYVLSLRYQMSVHLIQEIYALNLVQKMTHTVIWKLLATLVLVKIKM